MKLAQLTQKKVVVLGYGREGQATRKLLLQYKDAAAWPVWVESDGSVQENASGLGVSLICRAFDQGLMDFDVAIRSPGIPVDHRALLAFRHAGGEVLNPSSIFFSERPDAKVVGVTGSKGKSTTSSLLAHLINHSEQTAVLAGNIGRPLVGLLDTTATLSDEHSADIVVAELSSYQLCDLEAHLSLSLITRLFPEHIDWHGSVAAYYAAKMRLFDLTKNSKVLVNARDPILMAEVSAMSSAISVNPWSDEGAGLLHRSDQSLVLDDEILLRASEWALAGRHNLDNAVMALSALDHLGLDAKSLAPCLASFNALAHRLQHIDGPTEIRWINDSIATTPYATRAALESFEGQAIVLLVGGHERGGDWSVVIEHLRRWPLAGLIALPDNGARIIEMLSAQGVLEHCPVSQSSSMDQAIAQAHQMASSLENLSNKSVTVLLSPGAPSFGHYRNFEHRGEVFARAVGSLTSGN